MQRNGERKSKDNNEKNIGKGRFLWVRNTVVVYVEERIVEKE